MAFVENIVHEIGHYQKQSSAWFQAQSCLNNISANLLYNGPRALINWNDGFGGGSVVEGNVRAALLGFLFFDSLKSGCLHTAAVQQRSRDG